MNCEQLVPPQRSTVWYLPPPPPEDALQFFKEERVEGAVYNLYLKKVRYHTPSEDGDELEDSRVSLLQWRTMQISHIKAGTVAKLVEALTADVGELDSTYVNVFLLTYRTFSNAEEVLECMMSRYLEVCSADTKLKQQVRETTKKSLRTVLWLWVTSYPQDFMEDAPSYHNFTKLISFAEAHMPDSDLASRAASMLQRFQKEEEKKERFIEIEDVDPQHTILRTLRHVEPARNCLSPPLDLLVIPSKTFAEQLTYVDAELFRKVIPHQCLGAVWSRGDKKRLGAPSVYATVNQFNAVSYRVIATILKQPDRERVERVQVVEKWIDVAHELRLQKNFSSLKAIVSGLQSAPVYRLEGVWNEIATRSWKLFEELASIFSEDENQRQARELLMKEGTAKFAEFDSPIDNGSILTHKRNRSGSQMPGRSISSPQFPIDSIAQGTIPYLGTFLTDLTMIDAAISDTTDDGLINFEKRRKEFEILAQIKLLQSAASMYRLKPDPVLLVWFYRIRTYDDKESFELSCDIEPLTPVASVQSHQKKSSLGFFAPRRPLSLDRFEELTRSSPTLFPLDVDKNISNESSSSSGRGSGLSPLKHSISVHSLRSVESGDSNFSPWRSPETCVIRVAMASKESHHTNHYKSILLKNSDHTKAVITSILSKYNIQSDHENYVLTQILPHGELQIPDKGNVFYAINNEEPDLKFVLQHRDDIDAHKQKMKKPAKGKKIFSW